MLHLDIPAGATGALSVLCIGAHCDDIEIGCGGTLLELIGKRPTSVTWLICTSDRERAEEAKRSAAVLLRGASSVKLILKEHRDGFLPYVGADVKADFEALKGQVQPDLIFTHYRHDLHQDHRLASELTWNTFRNHLILEYEIPKLDGDLGNPNSYVALSKDLCQSKIACLRQSYPSQAGKRWFTEELFMAMLRLRGMECNSPTGLAEAFYCRKSILSA